MFDKEITNLLAYAETHLMLDELDKAQAARRIVALLKLDGYVPENELDEDLDIDGMTSPDKLLAPLIGGAVERGVITDAERSRLKAEIMDALILKPSEINDLFCDTHAVNSQKAFDFLYDYCLKDGYVDLVECAKNDRWEAKELKSKIEIIINLMPPATVDGYPACPLCRETVGYGDNANKRVVSVDLEGEEWFFTYSRHQYFDRHGVLVNGKHVPPTEGKEMLSKLLSAAEFIGGDGFVGTNALAETSAHNTSHEHFQTGSRPTPALKAGFRTRLKSKEYPYLEMGTVDWYGTVIRFSHSNKEKVVEFADKLITAWKNYSDDRIVNTDGKKNFVNVVARKFRERYCFDIILRSNALKKPRTSPEYAELKADSLTLTDLMGCYVLPDKLSVELGQVAQYLDGSVPFVPEELPKSAKPFANMVERMLKAQNGTVSKLEAKLNIHDEIDAVCEKILSSSAVFDSETIAAFLDTLDIHKL